MLLSLSIIFIFGIIMSFLSGKLKLPALFGMILLGILIGPSVLNVLDEKTLSISGELRRIALIIILTRAGLGLNLEDLKRAGLSAILLCFVPAVFEVIGIVLIAPRIFPITTKEAFLIGSVLAAVSPAVVVPKMIELMDKGYGTKKSIPQMILAASSVDDVFVIVMFSVALSIESGGAVNYMSFLNIPLSIALGIILGIVAGFIYTLIFKKARTNMVIKLLVLMSFSFLMVTFEDAKIIPISGLIAVMVSGMTVGYFEPTLAEKLSEKYSGLWIAAQILLFVLVGSIIDIKYATNYGALTLLVVLSGLIFRMFGVFISTLKSSLDKKEKLFTAIAYMPKATVQAAIGGIPLQMGLECGNLVLTIAVISILFTAPVGAFLIDLTHKKLLHKN